MSVFDSDININEIIYLDHAATTPVCEVCYKKMLPYLNKLYANPSGNYRFAKKIKEDIETARLAIAGCIGANPDEIYFTSGATEADNWAISIGIMSGGHLITDQMEHKAILSPAKAYEENRGKVTYVKPNAKGYVEVQDVLTNITKNTAMVTIMAANNEIGTIQPIKAIGAKLKEQSNIIFHTDAVAAIGQIPICVSSLNVDMLSASGHKFGAPKGVGFLYISNRIKKKAFILGGGQERSFRAGTPNVASIVGMGYALTYACQNMEKSLRYVHYLRDYLIYRILHEIPDTFLNGGIEKRLPGNVNICFHNCDSASLLVILDRENICASAGSACSSSNQNPSHVLMAIGLSKNDANSSLRFTLGPENTKAQIDFTVHVLKEAVQKLRN